MGKMKREETEGGERRGKERTEHKDCPPSDTLLPASLQPLTLPQRTPPAGNKYSNVSIRSGLHSDNHRNHRSLVPQPPLSVP